MIHSTPDRPIEIFLLLDNNHYDSIVKITCFSGTEKNLYCNACNSSPECKHSPQNSQTCSVCNKFFYNETCLANHITNQRCSDHSYRCINCKKVLKTNERPQSDHICGEFKCSNCKLYVQHPHECFMQRKKLNPPSEKLMFYDFETY